VRPTLGGVLATISCAGLVWILACTSVTSDVPSVFCTQLDVLTVGDTVRDTITTASCRQTDHSYMRLYRLQVATQTKLQVSLSSPLQPAFLFAVDSAGVVIANSSITSPLDTATTLQLIVPGGSYDLGVNSAGTTPSGPLRLVATNDSAPISGCVPVWVTKGITTTQTIGAAACATGPLGPSYPSHTFLTVVLGGRELQATEHATGFAPQVLVTNQGGTIIAASTVDSTGTNAVLHYVAGVDAALLLWVGSSQQLGFGQYTLTIN
jgi:hypothetical protein